MFRRRQQKLSPLSLPARTTEFFREQFSRHITALHLKQISCRQDCPHRRTSIYPFKTWTHTCIHWAMCAHRSLVCLWKDTRHQRIAALWFYPRADGAICCFFSSVLSCLVESVDLPTAPRVQTSTLISKNVKCMKLWGGKWQENLLVNFFWSYTASRGKIKSVYRAPSASIKGILSLCLRLNPEQNAQRRLDSLYNLFT